MHVFAKTGVAVAAAGIAVAGTVAAGGGVAHAATGQSVASCSAKAVVLEAGVLSACTAGDNTVDSPTSFTLTATDPGLTSSLVTTLTSALDGLGLASSVVGPLISDLTNLTENVTFNLACDVNGQTVTQPEAYSALTNGQTKTIDLQTEVGSPVPNSCEVQDFTVKSLVSLTALDLALINGLPSTLLSPLTSLLGGLGLGSNPLQGLTGLDLSDLLGLSLEATLTADTATPGAVWTGAGHTSSGLTADICADDADNGNLGEFAQVYQCNSDLSQFWVQASTGQLVHNGDCLAQDGSFVELESCSSTATQVWDVKGTGGSFNEIVNSASNDCLTWPKAVDFTHLTVTSCTGKAGQLWTGPAKSAA